MEGDHVPSKVNSTDDYQGDKVTLRLHKEALEIIKKWVKTADVKLYKNTYTEEKHITVPIKCEELVIEKKMLFIEGTTDEQTEIIRIPLSEERIEVTKQPVILENVEVYKQQFEEVIHFHEILKEEKAHIETIGKIKVLDESE
ncbi:YsnF/AvaK domain-containing protein [Bacillus sp. BRMEA1]|uniref:YsnF/AvaK domain-containing protein n=1 Tax=Neobacillus endophyticus TaxID=2738405 RepID=UPI00156451B8|nr:YsnF/AvaK domain-containing protein [Neobacillus endophyticus]NRD79943.1 YsnF/AvaK domain-containing protein [Neobacillus endophyticus]